jgi:two-component system sensor histidine kinase ResE
MINDLLDLSRLQAGKIVLDIQTVDINELISNIAGKFYHIFDSKKINFEFKRPDHPVFILADGDRIEQLMIIFIDNAIKFTPKGGRIEISLVEDDKLVRISIKDNGIGIPEEDIPYIWERFYKVDKSRTDKNSGTGLGLSIAKNIIELHNQRVSVQSKVGEGTEFEFTMKREA